MNNDRAFINYDQRFDPPEESFDDSVEGAICNELDLARHLGIGGHNNPTLARKQIARSLFFKYTTCGMSIEFEDTHIIIGSIVEGVERTTTWYALPYPFTGEKFDEKIERIEEEALEIWNATHGCEDCGDPNPYNDGLIAINPNCPTCGGEGEII